MKILLSTTVSCVIIVVGWTLSTYFQEYDLLFNLGAIILSPGLIISSIFKSTWEILHVGNWDSLIYLLSFIFYFLIIFFLIKLFTITKIKIQKFRRI